MGIETNTMGQIKALLPAFQFNWSQQDGTNDNSDFEPWPIASFLMCCRF
jgi:hypothetical protein